MLAFPAKAASAEASTFRMSFAPCEALKSGMMTSGPAILASVPLPGVAKPAAVFPMVTVSEPPSPVMK